jgi:hypothetical protein
LHYVLALRTETGWEFVPVPRARLEDGHQTAGWGSIAGDDLLLTLRFRPTELLCSGHNLQQYRNNWGLWPVIQV